MFGTIMNCFATPDIFSRSVLRGLAIIINSVELI